MNTTTNKWNTIKNFKQKYNYIMFEVILAFVVVMFGAFGVTSMIPVGMDSQRQAVGTSYMTDAAEQLLRYSATATKSDWGWLSVFADAKPEQNDLNRDWNSSSLIEVNNLRLKADASFDMASSSNSGLFLLEQLTLGHVDQTAIVRLWKEVTENTSGSIDAIIYAEVSWPMEKPYYAREKEVFSLQVSKAAEMTVASASYLGANCTVTKENGGGYSTTIADVTDNGDSTYTIELIVNHDGCSGSECPELDHFSVEADASSYTGVSFTGVSGSLDSGPDLSDDDFQGFKVDYTSGIGNGTPGDFTITYTLTGLQSQEMVAHGVSSAYSASFDVADFEYVLNCNSSNGSVSSSAADDTFTVDTDGGVTTMSGGGSSYNYGSLTVAAPGILANDITSDGSQLTAVVVTSTKKGTLTLSSDGSFTYVPGSKFKGKDGFTYKAYNGTQLTNVARVKINAVANDIPFDIEDGEVVPSVEYTADLKMLGAAITDGGMYDMPVTVKATVDGSTFEPWGAFDLPLEGNVNTGSTFDYTLPSTYAAGTPLSIVGRSWWKIDLSYSGTSNSDWEQVMQVDSSTGSANVLVLRDGDQVPDIEPFQDQGSIVSFLGGYIDEDQKLF